MRKTLKIVGSIFLLLVVVGVILYVQSAALINWALELPPYETDRTDAETVFVEMRDGIKLETHIYRPESDGPWPVVLIRDPYSGNAISCRILSRYGYACVHQDTRGRYGSEGIWYPVINERNDGLDTINWLVSQPWQDGNIATMGGSYVGLVQWAMIDQLPVEVKTVVAEVSHGDWYQIVNRGGHFVQGVMTAWSLGLHKPEVSLQEMAEHRPMAAASAEIFGEERHWYDDYIENLDKTSAYWQSPTYQDIRNAHRQAKMPVLMIGAWHDFFIAGQYKVFEELPRRADSLLAIRNGSHGPAGVGEAIDVMGFSLRLTLAWLDLHLKGSEGSPLTEPGYLLQSNADDAYEHFASWPEAGRENHYHLSTLAQSKECDGGGLAVDKIIGDESVSYVYDPLDPVPSLGGSYQFGEGVVDQGSENCARQDVLSFESELFDHGTTIVGNIKVKLQVASDAVDSAFTVKLQEKLADGRVLNIRDDITSLSFRNGEVSRVEYEPGTVVNLLFDLTRIKWTMRPGSSLRLDVSSSNFPFYNAHPNTIEDWSVAVETKKATQTLFSGSVGIPIN